MNPELQKSYLREFVRILQPGGVLVFQVVDRKLASSVGESILKTAKEFARVAINGFAKAFTGKIPYPRMQMHCLKESTVIETVMNAGASVKHSEELEWGKPAISALLRC